MQTAKWDVAFTHCLKSRVSSKMSDHEVRNLSLLWQERMLVFALFSEIKGMSTNYVLCSLFSILLSSKFAFTMMILMMIRKTIKIIIIWCYITIIVIFPITNIIFILLLFITIIVIITIDIITIIMKYFTCIDSFFI